MEPAAPTPRPGRIVVGYEPAATGATFQSVQILAGTEVSDSAFALSEPLTLDCIVGVVRSKSAALNVAGSCAYVLAVTNAEGASRLPSTGRATGPVGNRPPVLSWAGGLGYTAGGALPTSASAGSPCTFRIKCSDVNGDPPAYVKVHIYDSGGTQIAGNPFLIASAGGSDYVAGVVYTEVVNLLAAGSYTCRFAASDGLIAVGYPNPRMGGPAVTS